MSDSGIHWKQELVDLVREAAEAVSADEAGERSAGDPEGTGSIPTVLAYVQSRVEASPPQLLIERAVAPMRMALQAIIEAGGAPAGGAEPVIDQLLGGAALLPPSDPGGIVPAAGEQIQAVKSAAEFGMQRLQEAFDQTAEKLHALKESIAAAQEDAAMESDRALSQLDERTHRLEATLAQTEANAQAAITKHEEAFRSQQEGRDETFRQFLEAVREWSKDLEAETKARATEHLDQLARMEEEGRRLVAAVGTHGTADRFGQEAVEQRRIADWWRAGAVGGFLIAVAVAAFVVFTADPASDWRIFGGKLALSLACAALAGYGVRESAQHRARERAARVLELELTAFGPFIEPLDDESKDRVRTEFLERVFRGHDIATSTRHERRHAPE